MSFSSEGCSTSQKTVKVHSEYIEYGRYNFFVRVDLCSLRHGRDVPIWRLVIIYFGPFQTSYSGKVCNNDVDTGCFHAHTAAGRILHYIDDDNINYILRLLMTSML